MVMSLDDRYGAVSTALQEHVRVLGEGNVNTFDANEVLNNIKSLGGNLESLKRLRYEDILECFPNTLKVKPILLAKQVTHLLRNENEETTPAKVYVSTKKADKMTVAELVAAFAANLENLDSPVVKRLTEISKGFKFVVYQDDGSVNIDKTVEILKEIQKGYPGRDTVTVDGDVRAVYKITDLPDAFADENPLYPGRPLRPDGTCDQTGRSWAGIDLKIRQLVRLALESHELNVTENGGLDRAHNLIDLCMDNDALKKLRVRYKQAAVRFDELVKLNKLPNLIMPLRLVKEGVFGGPFSDKKKVEFRPRKVVPLVVDQPSWTWTTNDMKYRPFGNMTYSLWSPKDK